jgi:hypothetical protein
MYYYIGNAPPMYKNNSNKENILIDICIPKYYRMYPLYK